MDTTEKVKILPRKAKQQKKFILDCCNISNRQVTAWVNLFRTFNKFIDLHFELCILNTDSYSVPKTDQSISLINDYPIDFNKDFVVLFDSKTLSLALLNKFDTIFIEPQKEPEHINHLLYPILGSLQPLNHHLKSWVPVCTLITSMFNGDEYKEAFLENTAKFKELQNIETFIFRPKSDGQEHLNLMSFGQDNTSLIYVWLAVDPGLYDVWNLGVRLSSSSFCSNANIDDKRSSEHVFKLVKALEGNKTVDIASTSLRVTDVKNQSWSESENEVVWYQPKTSEIYGVEKLAKFNNQQQKIVSHNIPHCMPVWRTKLHRTNGYFTESRFGPSSDWEFWLRCGTRGSKLYLLNQDLGLHYRAPQSYWRRNPKAKNFDDIIVNEYFNGSRQRSVPLSQNLKSLEIGAIAKALKENDFWAGIGLLYEFLRKEAIKFESQKDFLKLLCESKLEIELQYLVDATNRLAPVSELKDTYHDFIGFYLRGLSKKNVSDDLYTRLLVLTDKVISFEDPVLGWISKAKVYQLKSLPELETKCLQEAYQTHQYNFWCNVNRVYGLAESLSYFLERLIEVPKMSDFSWLTRGRTLYFLPDYSHGNPYQKLLYQNFEQLGVEVKGLSEADSINLDLSRFEAGDVLHIHWINIFFNKETQESITDVLNNFMSNLLLLRQRGVKVVWTVHNRQNHEQLNLDIEYEFRNQLSKLCDAVLLHHPLIEMEIKDWLHENANIQIIEHGLYQDIYKNDTVKAEARKKIGIDEKKLTIATLGKIKEYKDLVPKIQVFKKAILENEFSANYLIAGKIFCKKTLAEIKSFKNDSFKVVNKFIDDDEVQLYLNSADYVLLSYRDILTSGGFFQAMSFSKQVLAPSQGSLKYYVTDGVNGYKYSSDEELNTILVSLKLNCENVSIAENLVNWPIKRTNLIPHQLL
ncbi:hypothetical protein [Aliiglaciecola sp. NS0011-25]|uniref:hypothetical protein n=1 Tax=Aliiglaciecola sp. NS0011-25 TaxID=3127654 RepID=UPI003103636B